MKHDKTAHAAKGRWRGILQHFGIPAQHLDGRQHACPLCGGKDRWRFDDLEGRGTSICNQCGARDGAALVVAMTGRGYGDVLGEIDGLVGNIKAEDPRPQIDPAKRDSLLREVYLASKPIAPGDLAHRYLEGRRIAERVYPDTLRFAPKLADGDGGIRPCMVAMVGVHGDLRDNGQPRFVTMHRTFLRPDGSGKAEMPSPRKMMPGTVPDGACVMLSSWPGHGPIGIAEGIETAMSASAIFDIPVWAALNATMMTKWVPPEGADEVVIFADHDRSFTGQWAAYTLARSLRKQQPDLDLKILTPGIEGTDWADEWMLQSGGKA